MDVAPVFEDSERLIYADERATRTVNPEHHTSELPFSVRRMLVVDTISWRPHLETAMEISLIAHERGTQVQYLNLRPLLPRVEDGSWLPRAFDLNSLRIERAQRLLQRAGVKVARQILSAQALSRARLVAREMLRACPDTRSICTLQHEGFEDIGWAVLSSVVETTRNPFASLQTYPHLFEDFLTSALLVYDMSRCAIKECAPDTVVLFNGRYATTRPILAAARKEGSRVLIHDRGCDKDHYWLATESIHDPDYIQDCIREFWHPRLAATGDAFFQGRRARIERGWRSYTKDQTEGRVPSVMDDSAKWVVFFTSSEDEYVAIGDKYSNKNFPAQSDAIGAVSKVVQEMSSHRLCVRLHPNIASKSKEQIAFWKQLKIPRGLVIAPDEDFDSYAVLERADVVCSYGSTVGIEASYWGKPSMLLGRSIYDRLGATFNASSVDDIRSFIEKPIVMPQLGALMYGAFFAGYGTRHKHYRPQDLFRGRILGTNLDSIPVRFLRAARQNAERFVNRIAKRR